LDNFEYSRTESKDCETEGQLLLGGNKVSDEWINPVCNVDAIPAHYDEKTENATGFVLYIVSRRHWTIDK